MELGIRQYFILFNMGSVFSSGITLGSCRVEIDFSDSPGKILQET